MQINVLTGLIADCQDRITYWRNQQDNYRAYLRIESNSDYETGWWAAKREVHGNLKAMELLAIALLDVQRQDIYGLGGRS